ncbi:MAG: MFS transporter [Actinomycetota bacterium]|nr:MFS transporter [Actinomycetota bacterium]
MSFLTARLPALRYPNYRRYVVGQTASIAGTFLQSVALGWLVLQLTGDGAAVGLVTAAQFAPALALGAFAGSVADRFEARRAVLALQVLLGAQASALAVLVLTGHAALWSLCLLAMVQGVGSAFDPPLRQSLMNETVGDAELSNAIATNSTLVQIGLILGPTLAAVLIANAGIGWCFAVNAGSYVVMFLAIRSIKPELLVRRVRVAGADASVRAGFAYLRGRADIKLLLVVLALSSMVALRLEVILPVLAKRDLGGGSALFSVMTAVRGVGALFAALYLAAHVGAPPTRLLRRACAVLAVSMAAMAVPNTAVVLVALFPAGLGLLAAIVSTLSLTQTLASPEFRGRVVAVWFVVMNGGIVFGALLTGAIVEQLGARTALLTGAALMAVVYGILLTKAQLLGPQPGLTTPAGGDNLSSTLLAGGAAVEEGTT